MFKKLLVLGVLVVLATTGAFYSAPVKAQAVGYRFVSICVSVATLYCPSGPNPIWFGPYATQALCDAAQAKWATGVFGTYPRSASYCYNW